MKTRKDAARCVLSKLFFVSLIAGISLTALGAYKTTYEIPAVVNVIGTVSDDDINDAIETANEILEQAGIRLSVVHTNRPFNIGNGTTTVTENEACGDGVKKGNEELEEHCGGANKGIKLYFVDGKLLDPKTTGYTPNGTHVGYVKKDTDTDGMGSDIAHEVAHMLGVDEDYASESHPDYDDNLMGYGGGSDIKPDQARRMRRKAKNIGKKVKNAPPAQPAPQVAAVPNPGRQIVTPTGYNRFDPNMILYDPPPGPSIEEILNEITKAIDIQNTQGSNNPDKDDQDDDSIVKFEIIPEGLLLHPSEMPAGWTMTDVQYSIHLFAPASGNTADIIVNIIDTGAEFMPDAIWSDSVTGTPMPLSTVELKLLNSCKLNNEPEEGGVLTPQCYGLFINLSETLIQPAGLYLTPLELEIASHAIVTPPPPDDIPITATNTIQVSMDAPQMTPDLSRDIYLGNNGTDTILYGDGFEPMTEFELSVDAIAVPTGPVVADPMGRIETIIPSDVAGEGVLLPDSLHRISLVEKPLAPLPVGQAPYWTTFEMVTNDLIEGDVNTDGIVNMLDLAQIAENWLSGQLYD